MRLAQMGSAALKPRKRLLYKKNRPGRVDLASSEHRREAAVLRNEDIDWVLPHPQTLPLPFGPDATRTASECGGSRKQPDTVQVLWGYD